MKNLKFNYYALILFFIIMFPNFIWFAIPAPNDILRKESVTPIIDNIASVMQVLMIIGLCLTTKKDNKITLYSSIPTMAYYICWILYYLNYTNITIIFGLCIFPCVSFILYEFKTQNYIALIPTMIFTIMHLLYGILNFCNY